MSIKGKLEEILDVKSKYKAETEFTTLEASSYLLWLWGKGCVVMVRQKRSSRVDRGRSTINLWIDLRIEIYWFLSRRLTTLKSPRILSTVIDSYVSPETHLIRFCGVRIGHYSKLSWSVFLKLVNLWIIFVGKNKLPLTTTISK